MRILVIFPNNPYYGGSAAANRYIGLFDGLLKLGCSIDLILTDGFKTQKEKDCRNDVLRTNLRLIYTMPFVIKGKMAVLKDYLFNGLFRWINYRLIRKNIKCEYDIIWVGYDITTLYSFIKLRKTIPGKFFIELNEFNDIGLSGNIKRLQYSRAYRENKMLVEALKNIDSVAAMTKTLENHYKMMTKEECVFIHLPMTVDTSRFNHEYKSVTYQQPYIAFTGTMNNAKDGVDVLIKAFSKISKKHTNIHLYLAGFWYYDVPEQDEFIRRAGLETRVHRLGVLTREEIPPLVCNATVLALSRPNSHQAQGGFPTKLGEYLASGNPVCVTKVGEITDYLQDGVSAFLAEPGDVDSFAEALDRALSDECKANEVGYQGRMVAEKNFSSELQANRLLDFFYHLTIK